jgi:tetratricopeptide (TPR) repeat protein
MSIRDKAFEEALKLRQAAYDSWNKSLHRQAEQHFRQALDILHQSANPWRDQIIIRVLADLARLCASSDLQKVHQAHLLYHEALHTAQMILPASDPFLALLHHNLACNYHNLGEYSLAEKHYRQALSIMEQNPGSDVPLFKLYLNNCALCLRQLGRTGEAVAMEQRSRFLS